ncbi:hypothetical protein DJ74_04685 [Halorubrum sp. Ea8]|nr:hypothetical protein DJ74_04685 [Halorubrum sp. Ea8]
MIDQHMTWCINHGINWLSVSWWGEGSGSDTALSDGLLEAEKFEELSLSILYETTRLEQYGYDLDSEATRSHLIADFQYLEEDFLIKTTIFSSTVALLYSFGSHMHSKAMHRPLSTRSTLPLTPTSISWLAFHLASLLGENFSVESAEGGGIASL